MIAYVCLCDAYTFCQFVTRYFVCGYELNHYLNYFYAQTVQYPYVYLSCKLKGSGFNACWAGANNKLHKYDQFDTTVQQRLASWYFISITIAYIGLFLNTGIIYELKHIIENPF